MARKKLDWNLVNPWARDTRSEEEKKQEKEQRAAEPTPPEAHKYMTYGIAATVAFAVIGGLTVLIIFRDASVQTLFAVLAVMVFLTTVVFGAALYISLGFLQRTMLAAKREKENRPVEPPEEWEMPKREKTQRND